MTDREKHLIRLKTLSDIVALGYMMFLSDKQLLEEAEAYVDGFVKCLSKEEMEDLLKKNEDMLEQAFTHDN